MIGSIVVGAAADEDAHPPRNGRPPSRDMPGATRRFLPEAGPASNNLLDTVWRSLTETGLEADSFDPFGLLEGFE